MRTSTHMRGFIKPKLIFSLVTVVLLASAIAIPLSGNITRSHAAGLNQEPHRVQHQSSMKRQVNSAGDPTFNVTTDASCDSATTVVPGLLKGDKVHIEAEVATTNNEPTSSEQGEQEFLKIFDTAGTFSQEVDYLASKVFDFTVTADNDMLQACILPGTEGNGPDGDEIGTIAASVTPAPTPVPTPPPGTSKIPKVPPTISRNQLLRLVGVVLSLGGPGLVTPPCRDFFFSKSDEKGGLFYECLSTINDYIGLVNEGKLFTPFDQFFLFHFQVLQLECQAGDQAACEQLSGSVTA